MIQINKIVDCLIEEIGEEKDRRAYEKIANAFSEHPNMVIGGLKRAQRYTVGKPKEDTRRYFMVVIKNLAQKHRIYVFESWLSPRLN